MVKSAIAEMRDRAKQNDLAMQIIKENYYLISEDNLKDLSEAFHIKITTHYKADKNSFGKLSVVPHSGSIVLRPEIHVFLHRTIEEEYDCILYTKELFLEILPDDWEKKVAEDKKHLDDFDLLPPDLKTYLTNKETMEYNTDISTKDSLATSNLEENSGGGNLNRTSSKVKEGKAIPKKMEKIKINAKDKCNDDKKSKFGNGISNQNRRGMQINIQSIPSPNIPAQPMAMTHNQEMNPPSKGT